MEAEQLQGHRLSEDANPIQLVIVNGRITKLSRIGHLPEGVFIGSIEDAPAAVASQLVGFPVSQRYIAATIKCSARSRC